MRPDPRYGVALESLVWMLLICCAVGLAFTHCHPVR